MKMKKENGNCEDLIALLIARELDLIKVKQVELAMELELEPKTISYMKKNDPVRFELLMDGMRCAKIRKNAKMRGGEAATVE